MKVSRHVEAFLASPDYARVKRILKAWADVAAERPAGPVTARYQAADYAAKPDSPSSPTDRECDYLDVERVLAGYHDRAFIRHILWHHYVEGRHIATLHAGKVLRRAARLSGESTERYFQHRLDRFCFYLARQLKP